tara:strand:+ start:886 stop:1887 length:1002 start_codon:yes stop_codon:yes gene_type:complete
MNLKISSYYYKHLLKRLSGGHQKSVKLPVIANWIGLSIKLDDFNQLALTCSDIEQDPLFVLRTAANSLPSGHGILGLLLQSCSTLGEACVYGYKLQSLTRNGLHSALSYQAGTVTSTLDIEHYDPQRTALLVEYCQASLYAIANNLVDWAKPIKIKEIHFMHKALGPLSEYRKILDTEKVLFSQAENKIIFAREIMDYSIDRADAGAKQVLLQEAKSQLQSINLSENFESKLRKLFFDKDVFNVLTLTDCAIALNVSDATLKRRLGAEGFSYQTILDNVRENQAKQYLESSTMSIQQISEALGFSNRSAFARSFRSWTGSSPLQYRQSSLMAN